MKGVSINYSNIVSGMYPVSIKICVNYIAVLLSNCTVCCVLTASSTVSRIRTEHIPVFAPVCTSPKVLAVLLFFCPHFILWQRREMFLFSGKSRPTLGSTQTPSRLTGTGFHTRKYRGRGVNFTTYLHLVTRLRMSVAITLFPPYTHPSLYENPPFVAGQVRGVALGLKDFTRILQWTGASELFGNSTRSSRQTACCSRTGREDNTR